jgi:hypothetical protein
MTGNTPRIAGGLVAAVLLLMLGTTGASARSVPRVAVVQRSPFVVAGSGFDENERLRLVVRAAAAVVIRTVRAGTSGAFLVRFPLIRATRCDAPSVAVHRRSGTVVRGLAKPLPECVQRAGG